MGKWLARLKAKNQMEWCDSPSLTHRDNMTSDGITAILFELSEEDRYIFEERAAIMEYDGGLTRSEAEKGAKACLIKGKE